MHFIHILNFFIEIIAIFFKKYFKCKKQKLHFYEVHDASERNLLNPGKKIPIIKNISPVNVKVNYPRLSLDR